jgi:hypothetical protein
MTLAILLCFFLSGIHRRIGRSVSGFPIESLCLMLIPLIIQAGFDYECLGFVGLGRSGRLEAFVAICVTLTYFVLQRPRREYGSANSSLQPFRLGMLLLAMHTPNLLVMGIYLVLGMAVVILAALGAVVNPILGVLLAFIGILAALGVLVWVSLRLSLLSPIAFATGKVSLASSWAMTKGHVLPLLGAFVLAVVMGAIVSGLVMAVFFGFAALIFGLKETGAVIMNPDMSSLAALTSPLMLIYYLVNAITTALTSMLFVCPAAVIYQQLRETGAEVFD